MILLKTRSDLFNQNRQANIELEMARAKVDGLEQTKEMYNQRLLLFPIRNWNWQD